MCFANTTQKFASRKSQGLRQIWGQKATARMEAAETKLEALETEVP